MKFRTRSREALTLNITSLIDVVFLLLIFFMVSTTFSKNTQLEVHLPGIQTWQSPVHERVVEVSIDMKGQVILNGKTLGNATPDTVRASLRAHPQFDPSQKIVLRADGRAPYQTIVRIIDIAGQLGYHNIQLLGEYDA
jgi:biopolymer transport protein ExbD